MVQLVKNWFIKFFNNAEVAILWLFILFMVLAFAIFGRMLAPVLVSVAIAYLLQWVVTRLENLRVPHVLAVIIAYFIFLGAVVTAFIGLLPLVWRQLGNLINELPTMLGNGQALLAKIPAQYHQYISANQLINIISGFRLELAKAGQFIFSVSVASIPSIIVLAVYLILVPLLVYFFLMDKAKILQWLTRYLPENRRLLTQVWQEVYLQTGNYVRGKALEMLIVWLVTYTAFAILNLQYAMLLSLLVGISVFIPYIGAVVVTVPIVIVGLMQWGWSSEFAYLIIVYSIIIAIDANILTPVLFAEVMNLHPVAIIIAVLIFGGLLGFWGIFFAIPLATLVKAILDAMPAKI